MYILTEAMCTFSLPMVERCDRTTVYMYYGRYYDRTTYVLCTIHDRTTIYIYSGIKYDRTIVYMYYAQWMAEPLFIYTMAESMTESMLICSMHNT